MELDLYSALLQIAASLNEAIPPDELFRKKETLHALFFYYYYDYFFLLLFCLVFRSYSRRRFFFFHTVNNRFTVSTEVSLVSMLSFIIHNRQVLFISQIESTL